MINKPLVKVSFLLLLFLSLNCMTLGNTAPNDSENWTIYSVYPSTVPIYLDCIEEFAEGVSSLTNGQIKFAIKTIEDIEGGGKVEEKYRTILKKTKTNEKSIAFGTATYWSGAVDKENEQEKKAFESCNIMYSAPFGLNAEQMYDWLFLGNGLDLWTTNYRAYGVVPLPIANTGGAMGGWFKDEIEVHKGKIRYIKSRDRVKIRTVGITEKIYAKLGAQTYHCGADEIEGKYKEGIINAAICQGPFIDQSLGLHEIWKEGEGYYYCPGWQERSGVLSIIINQSSWEALPRRTKDIFRMVSNNTYLIISNRFKQWNKKVLKELVEENKVKLRKFPEDVLQNIEKISKVVQIKEEEGNSKSKDIYSSYNKYKKELEHGKWKIKKYIKE